MPVRARVGPPFSLMVTVVEFVPSIPVQGALVKAINISLNIRLAAVQVSQGLMLVLDIINLLDAEGVVKTLPVTLQING